MNFVQKNTKVLVVDDEASILMSLEFAMKKEGFEVFIARDGKEALDAMAIHRPDIAILDIMMPNFNGYQVCEKIKSTPEWNHCRVVFLSAKSAEIDIQKGYEVGADIYVTKPFSPKQLIAKINSMAVALKV